MRTRVLSAEQAAARNERRARFRAMAKRIAEMTEAERSELAARMVGVVTVEGRRLSLHNNMLLALQRADVTVVGGFRQWIKAGRAVRKGEHGMTIWVAAGPDTKEGEQPTDGEMGIRFLTGTVFDVSQTDEIASQAAA